MNILVANCYTKCINKCLNDSKAINCIRQGVVKEIDEAMSAITTKDSMRSGTLEEIKQRILNNWREKKLVKKQLKDIVIDNKHRENRLGPWMAKVK